MLEVLQCYSSSPFKLEDQNCLTWPGNVLTVEDDYSNFGCGNMVKLTDANLQDQPFEIWNGNDLVICDYTTIVLQIKLYFMFV